VDAALLADRVGALIDRHAREGEALLHGEVLGRLRESLEGARAQLVSLLGVMAAHPGTRRPLRDEVLSWGERLSSQLVAEALDAHGVPGRWVDARRAVRTDDHHGRAEPLAGPTRDATRAEAFPILDAGGVPVMGGFIGSTPEGITTTLGRGGSDYSASLIGAALQADAIEIWTDVDGMLTADPRVVQNAQLIERIRFDEASELASFGAKVLHPSTIAPAVRVGIPVYIYNSRNPAGTGTLITSDAPRRPVSAIAAKSSTTVIKLRSARMLLVSGFMRTVFEIFDRHRTSVDVIATSEVSLSVTLDDPSNLEALLGDLMPLGDVSVERGRAIVSIVGAGLSDSGAALARAFAALGELRVHMASLSATGINLTLVVDGEQVAPAMKRLHDAFFGAGAPDAAAVASAAPEAVA
jgi:aspartate kinase